MSYILDALKKSDQERQQGNSPHLYALHHPIPPRKNSAPLARRLGLWVVGGVLLLGVCLALIMFFSWQDSSPSPPVALNTTSGQQTSGTVAKDPAAPKTQPPSQENFAGEAGTRSNSLPQVIIKESDVIRRTVPIREKSQPPSSDLPPAGTADAVAQLQDFPANIQAAVPELKFAGHTYSAEPAQRMIIVNGRILREGDTISAGTYLAQITPDGVIIDFQGHRFLVKSN